MRNLDRVVNKIEKRIDKVDSIREKVLVESREVVSLCRKSIQLIHRNEHERAEELVNEAHKKLRMVYKMVTPHPEIVNAGFVENAAQEVVEARCILNLAQKKSLPDPDKIGVSASAFLLGLCDAVGELRRFALDALRGDRLEDADQYIDTMERIYDAVLRFDYPSSLVPIKKKQDKIRSLIEKTRSEVAIAACERRIRDKVDEFRSLLDSIEGGKKIKKKKKSRDVDLDIDRVW
ncbi:MAG TPA: RNA-binding protein [Thermoplasmatales archaeon]|nr:RNA-binding protein [Thermoplasmatales archaeon]